MSEPKSKQEKPDRLKPISLHPLTPEEALRLFMKVDPAKVRAAERHVCTACNVHKTRTECPR